MYYGSFFISIQYTLLDYQYTLYSLQIGVYINKLIKKITLHNDDETKRKHKTLYCYFEITYTML